MRRNLFTRLLLPATVLAAATLTACAPQQVRESGAIGVDAQVGNIDVRGVHVEAPEDHLYQRGDTAVVWLTLLNQGTESDSLVALTSKYAQRVDIEWDRECDGETETVDELPLRPAGVAMNTDDHGTPPFGRYHLRVTGMDREVLAGTELPMTFEFERAGRLTLDARVMSEPGAIVEPSARCAPADGKS